MFTKLDDSIKVTVHASRENARPPARGAIAAYAAAVISDALRNAPLIANPTPINALRAVTASLQQRLLIIAGSGRAEPGCGDGMARQRGDRYIGQVDDCRIIEPAAIALQYPIASMVFDELATQGSLSPNRLASSLVGPGVWMDRSLQDRLACSAFSQPRSSPPGDPSPASSTQVWDGDGKGWCAEDPHVRIAGMAAHEMNGAGPCNQRRPDISESEAQGAFERLVGGACGAASTSHIVAPGPRFGCRSEVSEGARWTAAQPLLPSGSDLSCAMLRARTALRWDRYWKGATCA